jgi:EAL domain-containing protein (putative c-di-GMP-specific phosphodiesterase class I)
MAAPAEVEAHIALPRPRFPGTGAVLDGTVTHSIALQPIVDLQRGEVVGFEALARFGGRQGLPGPWLTRARDSGDLASLEVMLLSTALEARDRLPPDTFLAINVSPQLVGTAKVRAALRSAGDLSDVVLECTEHVEYGDLAMLRREVATLRSRGLRLALDDVGAGWSGLRQIAELAPDIVKVDRSLVAGVHKDAVKGALLELLVAFTGRLGGQLLVEGVEEYEELDYSARMGASLAQGFVLGRPSMRPCEPDDDLLSRVKCGAGMTRHHRRVASHLDVAAPVVRVSEATQYPSTGAPGAYTVLLDDEDKPTHLYEPGQPGRMMRMTTVLASDAATAALRRAMTRGPENRFDPMACVDKAGRYVGLIHVDSLVRSVLTDAEAADDHRSG